MSEACVQHLPGHDAAVLEALFFQTFTPTFATLLKGGADEPFYRAPRDGQPAVIHYRHDYVASALHEVAHWCIAGEHRRQLDDFGYWYAADGRDPLQQQAFEQVEVKPQALELLFSRACGLPFRVSVDNLALPDYDAGGFAIRVEQQAQEWLAQGTLPPRAARWIAALEQCLGREAP